MTRDEKLAELANIAAGIRFGMRAFDDRLEEMGPGVSARGPGGGKGSSSSPVEGQVLKPARVVTSEMERAVDRAHAAILNLDAVYGEIARTQRGRPTEGEPSCAWCQEAVVAAAKVEKKEGKAPIPLDYRSRTYLYAEERKGDKVIAKVLVCEWCFRFDKRNGRKPTIEERWIHAQGGQVHPGRANSVRMKAASRSKAHAK